MAVPHSNSKTARRPLRLRLKPKTSAGGYVDGGWWPRSMDLTKELPALADVLAVRLGSVHRVVYPLTAWLAAPRRTNIAGHAVRLEGFNTQDENTITIVAPDRRRIRLLVIPPDADDATGHDAMMTAAGPDNRETPAKLLAGTAIPTPRRTPDDAKGRWESEGGPGARQK
ncbi:MAG: DUF5994 family protein [Kibdelosporangium sp.]